MPIRQDASTTPLPARTARSRETFRKPAKRQKEASITSTKKLVITAIFTTIVLSLFLLSAAPCRAQANSPSTDDAYPLGTNALRPWLAPDSDGTGQPAVGDPAASIPAQAKASTASADDAWHFAVSPYLWFPGVHGTVVGPNDNGVGFRASPSDLLSHFRFGLMASRSSPQVVSHVNRHDVDPARGYQGCAAAPGPGAGSDLRHH